MTYKKIFAVLVIALLVIGIGCTKKTGVTGQLILQTGQTGDVRNCRVRLFVSSDLTGAAVKEVASNATGVDQTKSTFEITDVVEGYYYLLAWKDLNGSGVVDNNDIVGVHGGTYIPGYGGTQLTVKEGKMTDVGDIEMLILKELSLTVTAARNADEYITFSYSFNDNCTVTGWALTGPGGITGDDHINQNGAKIANTTYTSGPWSYQNGDPLPVGAYIVTITGSYNSNTFTLADTLSI
jgi:uncharacterized protein (DUF2141 family)